jgi:hypothetical protein
MGKAEGLTSTARRVSASGRRRLAPRALTRRGRHGHPEQLAARCLGYPDPPLCRPRPSNGGGHRRSPRRPRQQFIGQRGRGRRRSEAPRYEIKIPTRSWEPFRRCARGRRSTAGRGLVLMHTVQLRLLPPAANETSPTITIDLPMTYSHQDGYRRCRRAPGRRPRGC